MREQWIIGVDGSFGSRSALEWALANAPAHDADVTVVHAHHQGAAARVLSAVHVGRDSESGTTSNALHELDASIADLVGDRTIERRVISGHPGRALLDAAADATLVVVGRHGIGSAWQHGLGSVSRHCVIHATVPTVVVPTDWEHGPTTDIVVGFDGSANASAAVRWALDFATAGTTVRALIAIEIAPWLRSDLIEERFADELRVEQLRLHDMLDEADPQRRAHREVAIRGARPALARAAESADLVVVGTHGSGRLAATVLGSVSTWMLDASTRPTVVVPSEEQSNERRRHARRIRG